VTDTPAVQQFKEQQTRHWNSVAGGWAAWLAWTEREFAPLTEWFAERAGWAPGARILDVASGSGYPALAAAARVRPGGTVVASDISPDMLAVFISFWRLTSVAPWMYWLSKPSER